MVRQRIEPVAARFAVEWQAECGARTPCDAADDLEFVLVLESNDRGVVRGRSFGDVALRAVSADGRGERVCRLRVPGTNRHALRREVAVSRDATPEVRRLRRRREQIVHTFGGARFDGVLRHRRPPW